MQQNYGGRASRLAYVVALLAAAVPTAALACRCRFPTPERAARTAYSIVLADVIDTKEAGYRRNHRLKVRTAWKRSQPRDLTISSGPGNCAATLATGHTYLIYLSSGADGTLSTGHCWGNLPVEDAASRIRLLGRPAS